MNQNFLWQSDNVPLYVMDNHRAALWCWLRHIEQERALRLLHIDAHYDTLYSDFEIWEPQCPPLGGMSIEDYLALKRQDIDAYLIRWDTYMALFLERSGPLLKRVLCATHRIGDEPRRPVACLWQEPGAEDLISDTAWWLQEGDDPWIVNVDLDYFFCRTHDDATIQMLSDAYVDALFGAMRPALENGRIAALTLCLSPDEILTGGWPPVVALCERACAALGVNFLLPP
ncbi:UPF0489 family protein [Acidovorax sp. D2M1]|uniref:UPF0489 family protein n=1 Tax=Acidovorax benzenivorans TaxID=2987520 RepID=A0ABT5RZU5_9BURK|nr:UPF0489 family protein [Acidovorax benzenivorans]MDD2179217.1 UPF0489 family protein [Acidovorax benzenivorans]